ncbi:MAG: DUF3431 domain-containing protein [Chthoniobacterales bacterium]|nr:DUF3431 domain-containing protein [Chthoniobacterales bacterium]
MNPRFELVVARHCESLAWLRRVPREFRVTVYDKGDGRYGGIPLPNTGREAHTYLHHITERHSSLADVTVFVQGHPFDHAPDLHVRLRALANGTETVGDFRWLGFLADTDDPRGRRLFVPWSKNPERCELELDRFHRELFREAGPDYYRFFAGAQFAATREAIRRRDALFYARARDLAVSFPHAAHCYERCWDRVFGADGTAGLLPDGRMTAYFKPVKRLVATKDPLVPPAGPR